MNELKVNLLKEKGKLTRLTWITDEQTEMSGKIEDMTNTIRELKSLISKEEKIESQNQTTTEKSVTIR